MHETSHSMIAQEDIPELGIEKGDLIRWRRTASGHPFTIHRAKTFDFGALLVALNEGRLEPLIVTPASSSAAPELSVEEAVGRELPPRLRLHRRLG